MTTAFSAPHFSQTMPGDGAPGGEETAFVSLGSNCFTAWQLGKMGVRRSAMPFDWLWSDPAMAADCMEDDFELLMTPDCWVPRQVKAGVRLHAHKVYSAKYGRAEIFQHHDPTTAQGRAYFERAIRRFRDLLAATGPKVFVVFAAPERARGAAIARLSQVVSARTQNAFLLTIRLMPKDAQAPGPAACVVAAGPGHAMLDFTPTSDMQSGIHFVAAHDDAGVRRIIADQGAAHLALSRSVAADLSTQLVQAAVEDFR